MGNRSARDVAAPPPEPVPRCSDAQDEGKIDEEQHGLQTADHPGDIGVTAVQQEEQHPVSVVEPECCVCLGPLADACKAPCQHTFCRQCIIQVIEAGAPHWSGACPLCRSYVSVYNLRDLGGAQLAKPDASQPFGLVFVQQGGLGIASYHFDTAHDCYISYADSPNSWRLDDGSRPPAKVPWTQIQYDADALTFHGVIEWAPTFDGAQQWDYEIRFSEDFSAIVGGQVSIRRADGSQLQQPFESPWGPVSGGALSYLRWLTPPSTVYGGVYVQGSMYHPALEGIASYHFDGQDACYISYASAPPDWRLDDGSRPPERKPFSNPSFDAAARTFRGTVEWAPPFRGSVLWEYEMIFAEDFGAIEGGRLRSFKADGSRDPDICFRPHWSARASRCLCYVRRPDIYTWQGRATDIIEAAAASPGA
mmetsp:Transcript_67050/g.196086  ORF Transcript_67050/g.196086 Transcript_67050/m.196086 type:complete len:421 (-) Transcript_67050:27-1289(-)